VITLNYKWLDIMCDSSLKSAHLGEEILATTDPKNLIWCKDVLIFYFIFPWYKQAPSRYHTKKWHTKDKHISKNGLNMPFFMKANFVFIIRPPNALKKL
jgi:hypothetical protein